MAQVHNTSHEAYSIPSLDLYFEADEIQDVDDGLASTLPPPFEIVTPPPTPPAAAVAVPAAPSAGATP